ncbi:MAG TPA: pyridoxamine 5'-phosphate oxidase family protein [Actinophytocola sp.]|uniref:pyridoxamine 5'-phosphate oxidase family protein n=1 Tax=Actinophytocola sp. TaxID=1872138 RepID=UPI002DB8CC64|nr:pyridoxamine 5'-phosphate oxidase family protein [Actinophytocola sp.]HEU5469046.1 pyridoxamine 5'-phosphate oxidase family protein [Actinophytocola sp.]
MTPLSPTTRSTINRGKNRAVLDRAELYAVLDAGLICHLAFVVDGAPVVIPTGYGREGDTLYLHGSTGAGSLRVAAGGAQICVNVTLLDGIVYGRSVFHNSANYRSAVIHGRAETITDPEAKLHGLRVLTEHLAPGSWDYARAPSPKEFAATALLTLDLGEAAVKIRSGPPVDDDADVAADERWAGVLPVSRAWAAPESCPLLDGRHAVPPHVAGRATLG